MTKANAWNIIAMIALLVIVASSLYNLFWVYGILGILKGFGQLTPEQRKSISLILGVTLSTLYIWIWVTIKLLHNDLKKK